MSARIVLHPKMSGSQIAEFCERFDLNVEITYEHGRVGAAELCTTPRDKLTVVAVPRTPWPEHSETITTYFECARCGWKGLEPAWLEQPAGLFDSQVPAGHIPACLLCLSVAVTIFPLEEGQTL